MAKRVLAIGVGGSGKMALTILKERLEETYGRVPDNVVLLALDTDSLRDGDRFAGTQLNPVVDDRGREAEFQHVTSPGGVTMNQVFADITSGKTAAYMRWLEKDKLDRILSPAERDIRGGAQQRRPVGRAALFLRYTNPVSMSIRDAITRMYGEPEEDEQAVGAIDIEKGKRLIFIVGSLAGGTGSGFMLDVANLVRHAVRSNDAWQSVSVAAIIVLPDAFAAYTRYMDDPTNLKPNSFAALRELDRFTRVHSSFFPYMIRYAEGDQSITWSTNQPLDHVYLVDTASRSSAQDFDLSGEPTLGVFPVIADFLYSHIDRSLGDELATLRSNAGMHYDKGTGRMYSSFNVMSYIFPVGDVIESFSYRFLREILAHQFLPIPEDRDRVQVEQAAQADTERRFTESTVAGKPNPEVIQKAIACTRRIEPERPDLSWAGLFSLISLSESAFAQDYETLEQTLAYLQSNLILTKEAEQKRESFEDGYVRLKNFGEDFADTYLGAKIDPDDDDSRFGGQWDTILGRYRDVLRERFAEVLDAALLEALNRRDANEYLERARLAYARTLVRTLKSQLVAFKELLQELYHEQQIDTRLRQASEQVRDAITWMYDTQYKSYLPPFATEPRRAQQSYVGLFVEKMELTLHQRIYQTVIDILDSLGAAEQDSEGQISVVDLVAQELENWQETMKDVEKIFRVWLRQHNANRDVKKDVKVRRYLTNDEFEDQLYQQPEHFGVAVQKVLGQVGGEKGLTWQRVEDPVPLSYKLVTTWGEQARGAKAIAQTWFEGARDFFQMVRENVTVAERVAAEFRTPSNFVNRANLVEEPFLRYNPARNDTTMFRERYVSFNLDKASDDASRQLLERARGLLGKQGFSVDATAESTVACTVVEVSRGVRLTAVEQFRQCQPEYWVKLEKGKESIHLFPEEQVATDHEQMIRTLDETDNQRRVLQPELVVAMGDPVKLRAFVLACGYGLVEDGRYRDPETGEESTELYLVLHQNGSRVRLPLSQSQIVRDLEPWFVSLPAAAQLARLHLDALQNFMLKLTEIPGIRPGMVPGQVQALLERGVALRGIENPFTLKVKTVYDAIAEFADDLSPSKGTGRNERELEAENAARRLRKLEPYLQDTVQTFKELADPRVRDLGTVMHLILKQEINALRELAARV